MPQYSKCFKNSLEFSKQRSLAQFPFIKRNVQVKTMKKSISISSFSKWVIPWTLSLLLLLLLVPPPLMFSLLAKLSYHPHRLNSDDFSSINNHSYFFLSHLWKPFSMVCLGWACRVDGSVQCVTWGSGFSPSECFQILFML